MHDDDDDLPVLDAIVRGGDRAVILSTRLELALDPSRDVRPRPPLAGRKATRALGFETDDVARIDLGQIGDDREAAAEPTGDRAPNGPIDIDADSGTSGGRAMRRLDGPTAGHRPTRAGSRYATSGRIASVDHDRDAGDEFDETLALDDLPLDGARSSHHRAHVSIVPTAGLPLRAVAANDRGIGPANGSTEITRIEGLVDEIVERHVATLRRDVRAALERALRGTGTGRS